MRKRVLSVAAAVAIAVALFGARSSAAQSVNIVQQGAIPLRLSDAAIALSPGGAGMAVCTLRNAATQRVLAVALQWTFTYSNGHAAHGFQAKDYLYNRASELEPGASDRLEMGVPHAKTSDSPVAAVTVEVAGAELADGTVLGPDSARLISWLADVRSSRLHAFQKLLGIYRQRGEEGLSSAINSHSVSDTLQMNALKKILDRLEVSEGMPAVVERVKWDAAVKAPSLK